MMTLQIGVAAPEVYEYEGRSRDIDQLRCCEDANRARAV